MDTVAGELSVPECIVKSAVSTLVLTWNITIFSLNVRSNIYRLLETKVSSPSSRFDIRYIKLSSLCHFRHTADQLISFLYILGFLVFDFDRS